MECPKCNQEIAESSAFCNLCGANQKSDIQLQEATTISPVQLEISTKNKKSSKPLLLIGGGVAVLVAAVVLLVTLLPDAQDKFFKAIANGQAEEAISVYNENISGNSKAIASVNDAAIQKLQKIRDLFFDGKANYEETTAEFEKYSGVNVVAITEKLGVLRKEIERLHASNLAYEKAVEFEQAKKTLEAVAEYAKVIEDDVNYSEAQIKIGELAGALIDQTQALYDKNEFRGALAQARVIKAAIGENESANTLLKNCKDALKEQLTDSIKEYKDAVDDFTLYYSNLNKVGRRGSGDNYFGWVVEGRVLISPLVEYVPVFVIRFEFAKQGWLFVKELKLKSDSYTVDFQFDYNDVTREVVGGGEIMENAAVHPDAEQMLTLRSMLNSGEPILLRFYGQDGNIDATMTDSQKKDLLLMLDYYDCVIET